MWISMFDFSKSILQFKSFIEESQKTKWDDIIIKVGIRTQITFKKNQNIFVLEIQPRFIQRELEITLFKVDQKNHFSSGGFYYHTDSQRAKNQTFQGNTLKTLVNQFRKWLQTLSFDIFLSFGRSNEALAESMKALPFGPRSYLSTGNESTHLLDLVRPLQLSSTYQGGRYQACLNRRVYDQASILLNWSFYPAPHLYFVHTPHDFHQKEDLDEFYTLERCHTTDQVQAFMSTLDYADKEREELNTLFISRIDKKYKHIDTKGYRIGISMDYFSPRYQIHFGRDSLIFTSKEEAIYRCVKEFEQFAATEIVRQKIIELFTSFDKEVRIQHSSVNFLGHSLPFKFYLTHDDNEEYPFWVYQFETKDEHSFTSGELLFQDISPKISAFARKNRLPSVFRAKEDVPK